MTATQTDASALTADALTSIYSVLSPFVSELLNPQHKPGIPSVYMLPSALLEGMAPRIMTSIQSIPVPLLLDSGAEVSVLPLELNKLFQPPVQIPDSGREVRAFGNATISLLGPVPLSLTLCGIKVIHPFYFIDAPTPPIAGYDLMKSARLVVDVDNRVVWSRLTQPLDADPVGPNPSVPVANPSVRSQVSFVQSCPVTYASNSGSGDLGVKTPLSSLVAPVHSMVEFHSGSTDPGAKTLSSPVISPVSSVVEPNSGSGDPGVKTPPFSSASPVPRWNLFQCHPV